MTAEQVLQAGTSRMQNALETLEGQTETTLRDVARDVGHADLTEITHALELLRNVAEGFGEVISALRGRATKIRERDLTERRGSAALEVMDAGLAHLDNGQLAAKLVRDLLETAGRDLFQVADGQV